MNKEQIIEVILNLVNFLDPYILFLIPFVLTPFNLFLFLKTRNDLIIGWSLLNLLIYIFIFYIERIQLLN
jgi:hypothetical protein